MEWKIRQVHQKDWYGRIIYNQNTIELNMDITPLRRITALKHELLHAVYGPVDESLVSHDQIVALATFLATLPRLLDSVEAKYKYPVKILEEADGYRIVPGTMVHDRFSLAKQMIGIFCAYHKIYDVRPSLVTIGMLNTIPQTISL